MRADAHDVARVPARFSAFEAAAIGTAGYTAALSVAGLERVALAPLDGPVLVTGATGYIGGLLVPRLLDDGWTAVTRDRSLSAQFEHSIGITETGCEIFTTSPAGFDKPPYL